MKGDRRRAELMNATMELVAENGLHNFSMKKVTDKVGCSEMLIYKYFSTKEKLLFSCFERIHSQIGALFNNMTAALQFGSKAELNMTIRFCWMMYFNFLINNGSATIYYFAYRDSDYMKDLQTHYEESRATYFKGFVEFYDQVDARMHISEKVSSEHLWAYIQDTSGMFAKRVIRGELPNTPESIEQIWKLISGGILGLDES